ncbi:MAG: AAA family ATPase [Gammaproteobacteria bacterium]|nr:AAA family ATPase [Gammaproteobacteria bacterium]
MTAKLSKFVSFYSYKGWVGRSTILANLACWQEMQGKEVLIIDLDFEAPGQHKSGLFATNPIADSVMKGGLLDLFDSWKRHHDCKTDKAYEWDLHSYILRSPYLDSWGGTGHLEKQNPRTGFAPVRYIPP